MRIELNISKKKVTTVLVFIWLALSIVNALTQPGYVLQDSEDLTEESTNSTEQSIVLKAQEAVHFSFNLNLEFQSILVDIVEQEDLEDEKIPATSTFIDSLTKKIGILFKRIILKNAP